MVFDNERVVTPPSVEAAIAVCEAAGLAVVQPRDTPDETLQKLWHCILSDLRMASDLIESGAKLTVQHRAWLASTADPLGLLRSYVNGKVRLLLDTAVVVKEKRDAA